MADLGPGTMPRGKYPESPAPAGSHALISRTPTPGGMLHANLGLPRPPPRNFPPPLPRFPSRLSPRPISGTTVGRILSHPLPRRHAWLAGPPANTCPRNRPQNKRQQRPPTKPKNPRAVTLWRHACLTTPVVNTCSRNGPSPTAKESPNPPQPPRAAAPAAACVAGRSSGQHMLPQQALKTNGNSAPIKPMSFPSSVHVKQSP